MAEDEGARWLLVNVKGGAGIDWSRALPGGYESDGRPLYICRAALTHDGQPSDALLKVHPHRTRHGEIPGVHIGKCGPHLHGGRIPFGEKEVSVEYGYEILLLDEGGRGEGAPASHHRLINPRIASHHPHPHLHGGSLDTASRMESIRSRRHGKYVWFEAEGGHIPETAVRAGMDIDGKNRLYIARFEIDGGIHIGKAGHHLGGAHASFGEGVRTCQKYQVLCFDEPF